MSAIETKLVVTKEIEKLCTILLICQFSNDCPNK